MSISDTDHAYQQGYIKGWQEGSHILAQVVTAEMLGKIEAMRDLPPPYPADKENPMKHIYQNEGYTKALEDILSTE